MGLIAVNYHWIRAERPPHPGVHPISPASFEAQIDALGREREFVSLEDVLACVDRVSELPASACLITFDDGLREQFEVAVPILERHSVPAAFFVNTEPTLARRVSTVHKTQLLRASTPLERFARDVDAMCAEHGVDTSSIEHDPAVLAKQYRYDDPAIRELKYLLNFVLSPEQGDAVIEALFARRFEDESAIAESLYMTPAQWRDLADRGWLGSHGRAHVPLATLDDDALLENLLSSAEELEAETGHRPRAVSYPYGGPTAADDRVARAAVDAGYRVGFTMERRENEDRDAPLLLGRFDTNDV